MNFLYRRDDFFRNGGHVLEDFYANLTGTADGNACFHLNLYLESEWRDFYTNVPAAPSSSVFIARVLSGKQYREGESGIRNLEPGDVLIDRVRDEELFIRTQPGVPLRRIGLEIAGNMQFETFCCTLFPEPVTVIKCGEPERVKNIMLEFKNEIRSNGGRPAELSVLIFSLMQELAAQHVNYGYPEPLRKALEMIERQGFQPVVRADIAAAAGVSVRKLTSLFQKYLGCAPGKYIIRKRIDHAAELLKTGRFSVKDTARLAGFRSVEFFIREFKKFTGVTPGKF